MNAKEQKFRRDGIVRHLRSNAGLMSALKRLRSQIPAEKDPLDDLIDEAGR